VNADQPARKVALFFMGSDEELEPLSVDMGGAVVECRIES
jgi:hypothetical protein